MIEQNIKDKNQRKKKGLFRRRKDRKETVSYLINLCIGILEENEMAIGATIDDNGVPVPVIIDKMDNYIYQMNKSVIGPANK